MSSRKIIHTKDTDLKGIHQAYGLVNDHPNAGCKHDASKKNLLYLG